MDNPNKPLILITGCSGRIGSACAERLQKNYRIVGLDMVAPASSYPIEKVDLSKADDVGRTLAKIKNTHGDKIASVIHLAAYYSFSKGEWEKYQAITIDGTRHLLETLKDLFTVEQFIFSSTMLVHAPTLPGKKIKEESPVVANWNYPKSKILTETYLTENHQQIPLVVLRIAGVYNDQCHSIPLSNQVHRIYEKHFESRLFAGNKHHGAPFLHMDDLVDAICTIVEKRQELPKETTMLLAEPKTLSYDTLQKVISKQLFGKAWHTFALPKWIAKLGAHMQQLLPFLGKGFIQPWMIDIADDHYEIDVSKAKELIGFIPKHSLENTIPLWIDHLKKDASGWFAINQLKEKS